MLERNRTRCSAFRLHFCDGGSPGGRDPTERPERAPRSRPLSQARKKWPTYAAVLKTRPSRAQLRAETPHTPLLQAPPGLAPRDPTTLRTPPGLLGWAPRWRMSETRCLPSKPRTVSGGRSSREWTGAAEDRARFLGLKPPPSSPWNRGAVGCAQKRGPWRQGVHARPSASLSGSPACCLAPREPCSCGASAPRPSRWVSSRGVSLSGGRLPSFSRYLNV